MNYSKHLLICLLCISLFSFGQTGTTYSVSISSGGVNRTYTYYVPSMYNSTTDTIPLIVNIHGFTGSSNDQEAAQDFRKIADTANFIILHPQAVGNPGFANISNNPTSWNVWNTVEEGSADRTFIMAAVDSIQAHYNIDTNKLYATGYSQGGYMSYILSTVHSSRFTAMAAVAGSMSTDYISRCYPVHPLPIMHIHGTGDEVVAYNGTQNGVGVDSLIRHWLRFNNCNTTPFSVTKLPDVADSATIDKSTVVHYVYTGGDKNITMEFYKVLNGSHQIPSLAPAPAGYGYGQALNQDFTAAVEIWRFFRKYRLDSLYNGTIDSSNILPPLPASASGNQTGIDKNSIDEAVFIYPNPTNGAFTLNTGMYSDVNIKIMNVFGQVILNEVPTGNQHTFNLAVPQGVYFYQVTHKSTVLKNGKLVVR